MDGDKVVVNVRDLNYNVIANKVLTVLDRAKVSSMAPIIYHHPVIFFKVN